MHSKFNIVLIGPLWILSVLIPIASVLLGYRPFAALLSEHLVTGVVTARDDYTTDRDFADLERAVELSPDNCPGWWSLARSYAIMVSESDTQYTVEDPVIQKALIAHEALFTHCADDVYNEGHLTHAEILRQGQQYQAALQAIDLFIATQPRQSYSPYSLAWAYAMKGEIYEKQGNPVEAFKAIKQSALYGVDSLQGDLQHTDTLNKFILASDLWEQPLQPGSPVGFGRYVSAVEAPDGRFYLLATAVSDPSLLSLFEFHPNANWGIFRLLIADPAPLGTVAIDSAGYLHVAYSANDTAILYANTRNGLDKPIVIVDRTPTTEPTMLSGFPPLYRSVQISVDEQGGAHLVWDDDRYNLVEYTKVLGDVVMPPTVIARNATAPDIKVGVDGRVYVTYNGTAPFPDVSTRLWLIEGSNGQWGKPSPIGQTGMWSGGASLVVHDDGSLDLLYLAGTSADSVQLFHTIRNSNGLWSPPEVVGSGATRPWIPPNISYGGRTGPAVAALANNGLAVVWRGAATLMGTPVFGRIRQNGIWGDIETLGWISGENFRDSPTIVSNTKPALNSLTLLWSNSGELVMCVWNFADTTSCK